MDHNTVPDEIADTELLARYVVFNGWVRNDNTIRPEAFIPHPYPNLSVTRHIGLSENRLWNIGKSVASSRSRPLHGRADMGVAEVKRQELTVEAASENGNPNHANVNGWPTGKADQKMKALELAKAAVFISYTT